MSSPAATPQAPGNIKNEVRVVAVINIVAGLGGVLLFLITAMPLAQLAVTEGNLPEHRSQQAFHQMILRQYPYYYKWLLGRSLLIGGLGTLLVAASVGVMLVKEWGRRLSLIYGGATVAMQVLWLIWQLGMVLPFLQRYGVLGPGLRGAKIGIILAGMLFIVHAAFVLLYFSQSRIGNYLKAENAAAST